MTSVAAILICCWSVSLASPAFAQQDDIAGDIPQGEPFDGTSRRASPFDMNRLAGLGYEAVAATDHRAGHPEDVVAAVEARLEASGFPGTKVIVTAERWKPDRRCSGQETIEVRVRFDRQATAVEVVAASTALVSVVTYDPQLGTEVVFTPVSECVPDG